MRTACDALSFALAVVLVFVAILIAVLTVAASGGAAAPARQVQGGDFPKFPSDVLDFPQMQIDYSLLEVANKGVSIYSSLMPWHVQSLQKVLQQEFKTSPASIVDATAHIGVDTVNFMKLFPRSNITAIEIDPDTAAIARRNLTRVARALNIEPPNVVSTNSWMYIQGLRASTAPAVLYLDPPWGGGGTGAAGRRHLQLGGETLPSVIARTLKIGVGTTVVKLPRETNLVAFDARVRASLHVDFTSSHHAVCDARWSKAACRHRPGYWLVFYRRLK
jgi:predicted RNA methylase